MYRILSVSVVVVYYEEGGGVGVSLFASFSRYRLVVEDPITMAESLYLKTEPPGAGNAGSPMVPNSLIIAQCGLARVRAHRK